MYIASITQVTRTPLKYDDDNLPVYVIPLWVPVVKSSHYNDVIIGAIASQITSLTIVYSTVYSGAEQKKTSKLRVTGLCAGHSPQAGEFSAQKASNALNVSIWWNHHIISTIGSAVPGGWHLYIEKSTRTGSLYWTRQVPLIYINRTPTWSSPWIWIT